MSTSKKCQTSRSICTALVCSNRQIGEHFYRVRFQFTGSDAKIIAEFQAGQFIQLDVSNIGLPKSTDIPQELANQAHRSIILRRPFSFAEIEEQTNKTFAELLYCVIGPATLRMTSLKAGDTVSVIGPLGNGFQVPEEKKTVLLVSGGMGTPPLQLLAKVLTSEHSDIEIIAFAGAKSTKELPFEGKLDEISQNLGFAIPEFARFGITSYIATDDGSAGFHGFVTDCLARWFDKQENVVKENFIIFACGPEPMLASIATLSNDKGIDCQVSTERRMACGLGLCQSCAIECRVPGTNDTIYKLCCEDGPVFDAKEVIF